MRKITLSLVLITALALTTFANVCNGTYKDIVTIVEPLGWIVTSTTGGKHNKGSLHYQNKAVDLSCKFKSEVEILLLKTTLDEKGYKILDERIRPAKQAVWGGPHLHVYIPPCEATEKDDEIDAFDLVSLSSPQINLWQT